MDFLSSNFHYIQSERLWYRDFQSLNSPFRYHFEEKNNQNVIRFELKTEQKKPNETKCEVIIIL